MKKIISIALVAILLITVLVLPTSAASKNAKVTIQHSEIAPTIDGVVNVGEYGTFKIHSVDYSKDEFISAYDKNKKVKSDFYMTWTDESLYMAWVVHTDGHWPIPENYDHGNGTGGLGYMYMFSCVQFMLSTGAPDASKVVYQTGAWSGNYLEVGLSVMADDSSLKIAWSKPIGGENLTTDDWDFMGKRDEAKKTTTYEVRVPWNKSGIKKVGNGIKFGLTYAVADQSKEDFEGDNAKMAEWQDAILGGKNMDAGAIITLAGRKDPNQISVIESKELTNGGFTIPDENATELVIDKINATIVEGSSALITKTNLINTYNLRYSVNVLARPVTGKTDTYSVVSVTEGDGTNPTFDLKTGDIVLAFHTAGETQSGYDRVQLVNELEVGDEIVFQGFDMAKGEYTHLDPIVYVARDIEVGGDASEDPSEDPSQDESEVSADISGDVSEATSKPADTSKAGTTADNDFPWVIVIIIVGVLAIGGAVYFFVIKKKK